MATPPNAVIIPIVTYEYLFCLPSNERPRALAQRKAWGLLLGSCALGTVSHQLQPNKSGYDPVPSSGTRLGNLIPCTGYGPTTLG
jgi:hypothetical protein